MPIADFRRTALFVTCALALSMVPQAVPAKSKAAGKVFRDCRDCPEVIVIPAGSTEVGAGSEEHLREGATPEMIARESPVHRVTIPKLLAIGRYEVTRGEFAAFVAATGRDQNGCTVMAGNGRGYSREADRSFRDPGYVQTDRHPVVCVNWDDASAYTQWLSVKTGHRYRLPSEAEWEYAARAGTETARWWGDTRDGACANANVQGLDRFSREEEATAKPETYFQCRDGFENTAPVGSFKPNGFGIYDIHGNVWEWTADCHDGDVQRAMPDGTAYAGGACLGHMDRGASWQNSPRYVRSAARHKDMTGERNLILGFRVVRVMD